MAVAKEGSLGERLARGKVGELFGADLRALAVLRIVLAVLVLLDVVARSRHLEVHYTDDGVLPRGALLGTLSQWQVSLNLINGTSLVQAGLFGLAMLAAVAMLVGYRTQLATIAVWVMVMSIQWRNPFVLNDFDNLLRMLLFWSMFLPLGACWSVDRRLAPAPDRLAMRFLSWATVALFLQIVFMYLFTILLKTSPQWREDGTAIYYALSAEHFARPLGTYLTQFPTLLKYMTFGTVALEVIGPLLLFSPVATSLARTGAVAALMGFHLGIWLTMDLGLFPLLSAFCMVCFLPRPFWDTAVERVRSALTALAVVSGRARHSTRPLVTSGFSWFRSWSSASVRVAQPAGGPTATRGDVDLLGSDALTSRAPAPEASRAGGGEWSRLRSTAQANLLAFLFLLYVLLWNVTTVSAVDVPESIRPLGNLLGLKQRWDMFSPMPQGDTRWFVLPGTLASGQRVDLAQFVVHNDPNRAQEVRWGRPESFPDVYGDKYWRRYLRAIAENSAPRRSLTDYVCREWNAVYSGEWRLESLEIVYLRERTLPDQQHGATQRDTLIDWTCD